MRSRIITICALVGIALIGSLVAAPVSADDVQKFEGHLAAPGADLGGILADEFACPEPGDADGSFYKFFDLEGDFTHFKVSGPTPLYADPTGVLGWGDYDLDLYVFDAKCKQIGEGATPAGTESTSTKRPARYALVTYFYGIHANLPILLEASNSKIK